QTGVRLEAAREVADLKVTLRSRDLPLRRSLAEIAELLDLTWSRRGAAPQYRYECARSQEATLRAPAALAQGPTTSRPAVEAQMMRIAEAFRKGDPSSLAVSDPEVAAALNDPNQEGRARVALQYLSMIPPQFIQNLLGAGRITTTMDQMPPQAQE